MWVFTYWTHGTIPSPLSQRLWVITEGDLRGHAGRATPWSKVNGEREGEGKAYTGPGEREGEGKTCVGVGEREGEGKVCASPEAGHEKEKERNLFSFARGQTEQNLDVLTQGETGGRNPPGFPLLLHLLTPGVGPIFYDTRGVLLSPLGMTLRSALLRMTPRWDQGSSGTRRGPFSRPFLIR